MKTAVSIPDRTYRQAERLAKKIGKTRSALYAEALAEYLVRHDPETLTALINAAVDANPETSEDRAWLDASARGLAGVEYKAGK
jgi:predicted transcriptional regulator